MISISQPKRLLLTALVAASLAACSSSDTVPGVVLHGVAATGAALGNAAVTVTCNPITGTTPVVSSGTTDANGNYTVTADNGKPVCLVTATKTTNGVTTTLNSIALVEGTVNVNPITNLVVAGLLVGKGATTVAQLVTPAYAPTTTDVTAAQTVVVTQVNAALVTAGKPQIAAGTDLISGSFTVGSPTDAVLDTLVAANVVTANNQPTTVILDKVKAAVDVVVNPNPATGGV
jgi:hypothetical protein